jgi:hypothetical protein
MGSLRQLLGGLRRDAKHGATGRRTCCGDGAEGATTTATGTATATSTTSISAAAASAAAASRHNGKPDSCAQPTGRPTPCGVTTFDDNGNRNLGRTTAASR